MPKHPYPTDHLDNPTLQRLCGPLDGHLHALGKALNVQVSRQLGEFSFSGEAATAAVLACDKLAAIAKVRDLTEADIQLAVIAASGPARVRAVATAGREQAARQYPGEQPSGLNRHHASCPWITAPACAAATMPAAGPASAWRWRRTAPA